MNQKQKIQYEINSFYKTLFQKYKISNVINCIKTNKLRLCCPWEQYKDDFYFCSLLNVDGTSSILCTIFKCPKNLENFICRFQFDLKKYDDNQPTFASFEDAQNYANKILIEKGYCFLESD